MCKIQEEPVDEMFEVQALANLRASSCLYNVRKKRDLLW